MKFDMHGNLQVEFGKQVKGLALLVPIHVAE
jgi:hypothetical protein